ncbi:MAG: carbonic anhydrase, partial [Planctomycetota bacterium]|nr:carbonic anhydrase [Planctomycetota bacterium]
MQIIYLRNTLFLLVATYFASIAIADEATDGSKLQPLRERVLTQAEQQALTPEQVLEMLRAGNQRFMAGTLTLRDHS